MPAMSDKGYQRVLLKISGESFSKPGETGIDANELRLIAGRIADAASGATEIAVVVGGGNMIRGANLARRLDIDQATADYMGMLGTVMNGMALKEAIEAAGREARLLSAINMPAIAEAFIRKRALRAVELNCDILLKATKVDGVYSADPATNPTATRYDRISFKEAIDQRLGVMDLTALSMCMEHNLPIRVFDFKEHGNIDKVIKGADIGTMIDGSPQDT
jgi:uridylate kinase